MKTSKVLAIIFGIVILILIIRLIGLNELIEILSDFKLVFIPLILFVVVLDYVLAGLNTWFISMSFKKISLKKTIKATFITLIYATIIPGKIADLLMIPLLKKQHLTTSQATITVGIDKTLSLLVKIVFGLIGAIFILKRFDFLFLGIPILALGITISFVFIFRSKKILTWIKKRILKNYSIIFKGFSRDLRKTIKNKKRYLYYNVILTVIKTFLEALSFYVIFLAFGQETNIITIFFIFSLLSVIMLLTFPIGISGIGVREFVGIVIFGMIGVKPAVVFNSFVLRTVLVYLMSLFSIYLYREELNFLKKSEFFKKIKSRF